MGQYDMVGLAGCLGRRCMRLALGLLMLATAALNVNLLFIGHSMAQSPPAGAAVPVSATRAVRADVPFYLTGLGLVEAFNSVLVRTRVDGTLTEVPVTEGQDVKQGDLLAVIDPRPFNNELIALCDEAIGETCGQRYRLPSGPLHDAAEVARAGVPTVMMFVQSLHGISHNKIEDTKEEHLELCVTAFDKLAEKTIAWLRTSH